MSIYRKLLRAWLTAASLIGFLLGWILISHTTESENNTTSSTGETLTFNMPAIPSVDSLEVPTTDSHGLKTFTFDQNPSSSIPQMRTGGS